MNELKAQVYDLVVERDAHMQRIEQINQMVGQLKVKIDAEAKEVKKG
jgi:hypothetical protein